MGPNESRNLWISLGAGIFATFMLYSYSQEKKSELDTKLGSKVRVVVAKADINELNTIFDDAVEVQERYKENAEPEAFTDVRDVVGTVASIPIKKGQTITKNSVVEPGPDTGMAIQVSPNKRPVTIPTDPIRANGNLIRPGNRVDVFAAIDTGKGAAQKREMILMMQDITVLATGSNLNNNIPRTIEKDPSGRGLIQTTLTGDTKYTTVTLEVNADIARDLLYLVNISPNSIYLTLRNPYDKKALRLPGSTTPESILDKAKGQSSGFSDSSQPNLNNGAGAIRPNN